jgi:hypothetical protein
MRQLAAGVVVVGLVLVLSVVASAWAIGRGACRPGQSMEFAALRERLGATMGEPMSCMQPDGPAGDVVQLTTSGFAYRHAPDGPPTFTTGREFWALTAHGIEYWAGTPHMGFQAPSMAARPAELGAPPLPLDGTYASVEVAVVMQPPDPADGAVVVRRGGSLYRILLATSDPSMMLPAGRPVFIRSPGPFAAEGAELLAFGEGGSRSTITWSQEL